ncbi:DNA repair-scaffolding protein isoform X3 [Motacilla alba alba]|uniref:DNA repair-scaffolding protein isoform X3 n=1 Tax=Motacilla alba alba TaxID=1094192 RepID=UPI0018D555D8|nr:DNA repair-scaffolding protein isoform X3 [Motacilla alba alba]
MPGGKRKRLWNAERTPFPDETPLGLKKSNVRTSVSVASISNAWLRCGDGFESASVLESQRPSNKKSRIKKHLGPLLTSAESGSRAAAAESSKEAEDIIWTSSGSDFSDDGTKTLIPKLHSKKSDASKTEELPSRCDLLLEDRSSEDEWKLIDWEKDTDSTDQCDGSEKEDIPVEISDSDSCANTNSLPVKEENDELCKAISTEISEYSSDNDSLGEGEVTLATTTPGSSKGLQPGPGGDTGDVTARPASEWLKSAQALLRTPGKQAGKAPRAPTESAKKRKLLRGGLAERLCRLQNRERSAISFWRHQCLSDDNIPSDKSGVLIVKILEIFEECTIQVAICQQLEQSPATLSPEDAVINEEEPILKVLFTRETAAHLKSRPRDVIHIYPPWLCLLVQDAYGMFSEVQLQSLSSTDDIEQYCRRWEGKSCCLAGMKILQRTTRGRALGLFSLIDSLWPPVVPVKVPGQSQDSEMMTTNLPPPSFCYILTVQSGEIHVEVDEEEQISNLYQPPAVHGLKEILRIDGCNERCSFWAQVLYQRLQTKHSVPIDQREMLLFVTDSTLQNVVHGIPKVVAVSVTASCVLSMEIIEALSAGSQLVFFKDALWGNGRIICVERTVLLLQKPLLCSAAGADLSELTGPVRLDELDSTTQASSICALRGTVVGVNESTAFSWPTCNRCGNGKLEVCPQDRELLYCNQCSEVVTTPVLKMQLEVFLSCPSRSQSTVKVKVWHEISAGVSGAVRHIGLDCRHIGILSHTSMNSSVRKIKICKTVPYFNLILNLCFIGLRTQFPCLAQIMQSLSSP